MQGEEEEEEEESDDFPLQMVKSLWKSDAPPIVKLGDCPVDMEVDNGAAIPLMSESTFNALWPRRSLQPSSVRPDLPQGHYPSGGLHRCRRRLQ